MKDNFVFAIRKKIGFLEELLNLSNKQTAAVKNEKLEELQLLLDKKEVIIKKIDQLNQKLHPIIEDIIDIYNLDRTNWLENIEKNTEIPEKIQKDLLQLRNILVKLKEINDDDLEKLKEKRAELSKEMTDIHNGRKINKRYNSNNRIYSTFIDQKS